MIKTKKQQNKIEYPGYRNGLAGSGIALTSLGKRENDLQKLSVWNETRKDKQWKRSWINHKKARTVIVPVTLKDEPSLR